MRIISWKSIKLYLLFDSFLLGWEKVGWEHRYRLSRKLQAIKNQKNINQEKIKSPLKQKHSKLDKRSEKIKTSTTWVEKIESVKDYINKFVQDSPLFIKNVICLHPNNYEQLCKELQPEQQQ